MDDEGDYARLARFVMDRRVDLDRTQMEVAHLGGLSLDRVSAIERGEARNLRPKTIRALERGLDWEAGSVRAILAGGEPIPVATVRDAEAPEFRPEPGLTDRELDLLAERIREDPVARRRFFDRLVGGLERGRTTTTPDLDLGGSERRGVEGGG
jgi:hypothetical protein